MMDFDKVAESIKNQLKCGSLNMSHADNVRYKDRIKRLTKEERKNYVEDPLSKLVFSNDFDPSQLIYQLVSQEQQNERKKAQMEWEKEEMEQTAQAIAKLKKQLTKRRKWKATQEDLDGPPAEKKRWYEEPMESDVHEAYIPVLPSIISPVWSPPTATVSKPPCEEKTEGEEKEEEGKEKEEEEEAEEEVIKSYTR